MPEPAVKPEPPIAIADEPAGHHIPITSPLGPYRKVRHEPMALVVDACSSGAFDQAEANACKQGTRTKVGDAFAQQQLKSAIAQQTRSKEEQRKAAAAEQRHRNIDRQAARLLVPGMDLVADVVHLKNYVEEQSPQAVVTALGLGGLWGGREAKLVNQGIKNPRFLRRLYDRLTGTGSALRLPNEGAPLADRVAAALTHDFSDKHKHLAEAEQALYAGTSGFSHFAQERFAAEAMQLGNWAGTAWKVENPLTGNVETLRTFVSYERDHISVVLAGGTTVIRKRYDSDIPPVVRDFDIFLNYFNESHNVSRANIRSALASLTGPQLESRLSQLVGGAAKNVVDPRRGKQAAAEIDEVVAALNATATPISYPLTHKDGSVRETITYFLNYQSDGKILAVVSDSQGPSLFHTFGSEYLTNPLRDSLGMEIVHKYLVNIGWIR